MATVQLNKHFANPNIHKVSQNLREWTYCNGLMEANVSTWNKLFDIYVNKSNKKISKYSILEYLTCSENPDIIINFLNISTSNNSIIPEKIYKIIYFYIIEKHASNSVIVDYILANLKEISSRKYMNNALDDLIENVYSNKQLDKISKFIKNQSEEQIFEDVQDKIKKRKVELLDIFASFRLTIIQERK